MFGEFRLETAGGAPLLLSNRRGMLLVALLCLQPDRRLDRETLCQILWPDRFQTQAKASLRQCLLDLRHQFGNDGLGNLLIVTRSAVALDRNLLLSDLSMLEDALEQGDADQAATILEGIVNLPILQGMTFNRAFDGWLALKRQEVDARLRQAIARLVTELRAAGEPELSARLSAASQARYPAARSAAEIALAVLPLGQIDHVGGDFFLAEGITDELSARLGKVEGIALAGRTSILAVAERGQTLTEMAASLRVTHLVEGEVTRTHDSITARIALIEGATGTEIWADRITGSIDDFFDSRKVIGNNVIAAICRVLGLSLSPAPMRRMTTNRAAYALYLQGLSLLRRSITDGAAAKSVELLEEALALDPEFAECWTALADAHVHNAVYTLGSFLLYIGRTRAALPFIEAGVEQDPVYGRNYVILATAYFNLGEMDAALAAGQRMVDLGMPGMWLAAIQAASGAHEQATATYYASRMLMNTVILPPAGTEPMNDAVRDAYWGIGARGCCSGDDSVRMAYCAMLDGLHQTMPDPHDPSIAFPAIWMGHADLVMKIYRERIHPANMFGLMSLWADVEPIRRIRLHPGFMDFAENIGLVEAWNRHGWPDLMPEGPHGA